MARTMTLEQYLDTHNVPYEVITHERTPNSLQSAAAADVEADCLAKAVLLEDDRGYMMAVLPATRQLKLRKLRQDVGRDLKMADESEMAQVFKDCDVGAVPPMGTLYGVETVLDDSLDTHADLFLEAGDHEHLIHVKTRDFMALLPNAQHGHFTSAV